MNQLTLKSIGFFVLLFSSVFSEADVADRVARNFFHDEGSLEVSFYQDQNPGNVIPARKLVLSLKKDDFVPFTRDAVRCRNSEPDCWSLDFEKKRQDKKTLAEVLAQKYGAAAASLKIQAMVQAALSILQMDDEESRLNGSTRIFFDKIARYTLKNEVGTPMPGKSFSFLLADDCRSHFMLREIYDADGVWDARAQKSVAQISTRVLRSQDSAQNTRYLRLVRLVTQGLLDYVESEFPEKLR